jgi:hypothetical protein
MALRCPLRLRRPDGSGVVETRTENLSSDGFFCVSKERFEPGQRLECVLLLPAAPPGVPAPGVPLFCHVEVSRLEVMAGDGGFGLGCRITDFVLLDRPTSPSEPNRRTEGSQLDANLQENREGSLHGSAGS